MDERKTSLETQMKETVTDFVQSSPFSEDAKERCLVDIHQQLQKGSKTMKSSRKKYVMIAAAAMISLGAVTAFAAGKITSFVTSTNRNDAIKTVAELKVKGADAMGLDLRIPESLSGENAFFEGYVSTVDAMDENNNKVTSVPDIGASYGKNGELFLDISQPIAGASEDSRMPVKTEEYKGCTLLAHSDAYLFLPPDASPSAEDQALEAEGKLYISYGSSREERKTFQSVSWEEDGMRYTVNTFENKNIDNMLQMAKEIIDTQK